MPKYSMNICLHTLLPIEDAGGNRLLHQKPVVDSSPLHDMARTAGATIKIDISLRIKYRQHFLESVAPSSNATLSQRLILLHASPPSTSHSFGSPF
ncbi:hypothetical protein BAC3_02277 [uncultured bacterium]|nr:hypothetical protein BAC3_02277 [uncultured bacterium]